MKKYFIKFALLALLVLTINSSCDEGWSTPPQGMNINIAFLSPSGTNIIDSLNFEKTQGEHNGYSLDGISFNWRNKNNDLNQNWSVPKLEWFYLKDATSGWLEGSSFHADFIDISLSENGRKRDEEYTIEIKSKEIFGNDEAHTIKYYVHIKGLAQYDTYKCEVDGKEYPIMGPYVNAEKAKGQVTINHLSVAFTVDNK